MTIALARLCLAAALLFVATTVTAANSESALLQLKHAFERNDGQAAPEVRFTSRGPGYRAFFSDSSVDLALPGAPRAMRIRFPGASPSSLEALEPLPGRSNYLIGADPRRWQTNVPHFGRLSRRLSDGVEVQFYGRGSQLEFDFIVAPAVDPASIRVAFEGANQITLDASGDLVLRVGSRQMRLQKPVAYQQIASARREVAVRYVLRRGANIAFQLGPYDRSFPLVIDPVILNYSTYLGGGADDTAAGIAVDSAGNAYVTGTTQSANFPVAGPLQAVQGGTDVFVSKIGASGDTLLYSTYLGGSSTDSAGAIAVDSTGAAYITGQTVSTNFPVTAGAFQGARAAGACSIPFEPGIPPAPCPDAFVAKLSAAGDALVYGTYLGGSGAESGRGIAVDAGGFAYVTGRTASFNFPVASPLAAFGGGICGLLIYCNDVFVTRINATGSALLFSTYLGGDRHDEGRGIAVDADLNIYVGGLASSANFPVMAALQPALRGASDAFAARISAAGALVYSTYLGGSGADEAAGIALHSSGQVHIAGTTNSADFPLEDPAQGALGGGNDAFVARLAADGSRLAFSTYLGGSGNDRALGVAVDSSGRALITGGTSSTNFPVAGVERAYQPVPAGGDDAFVALLMGSGRIVYSTYLGGSAADEGAAVAVGPAREAYVAGSTASLDYHLTTNRLQGSNAGARDLFVAKLSTATANAVPALHSLSRTYGAVGGPSFELELRGANFVPESAARWNGSPRATVYVHGRLLRMTVPSADLGTAGAVPITVSNPNPGGGVSNAQQFTVKVIPCPLPGPVPVSPTGNILTPAPTYTWLPVDGADSYTVLRAATGDFLLSPVPTYTLIGSTTSTSLTQTSLMFFGDYVWRVYANSIWCPQPGAASPPSFFTFNGSCPLAAPALNSPASGAFVPNPPAFSWSTATATAISLLVVQNATTGATVFQQAFASPTTSFTLPSALPAGTYYWTVIGWSSLCPDAAIAPARALGVL